MVVPVLINKRSQSAMPKSPVIHIVEDDPSVRFAIETLLEGEGFAIKSWVDGRNFLDKAEVGHSDVVLLDLKLPYLTGTAIAEELRQRAAGVRIIVLTGAKGQDYERSLTVIEPYASFRKPLEGERLIATVRSALLQCEEV